MIFRQKIRYNKVEYVEVCRRNRADERRSLPIIQFIIIIKTHGERYVI